MKRFYADVSVAGDAEGYRVLLDGRSIQTPARHVLTVPSGALAEAVADEWRAQGETIERPSMLMTRLVSTALDRMPALRAAAIDEVLGYAETDLLCYHAAAPADLVLRQERTWQPWLDWLAQSHGAQLVVTSGMRPVAQPEAALQRLRAVVEPQGDWQLVGVHAATTTLGSVVLGLALSEGALEAEEALAASLLDELFEIERWGREREAERRHQALRRDVLAVARFAACLRSSGL